ncbi:Zinc finger protein ZAT9 [Sesamum angolense]|uniref:Zinc finger protein ZAT9 n=1 Tax=Sesamum angolense TaxID=2727404 RepID=A0AAE2C6W8_9LAMI|nr:Zinc finger protein ZAT9 [Sesamum angolense]
MEKRHRCKLCFRNFANGRALGGHMRSHMMKFYAAKMEEEEEEEQQPFDDLQSLRSYSSTSSSEEEEEEEVEEDEEEEEEESGELKKALLSYELRENPRKSTILVDHEFSSVVLQDRESETESSKKDTVCRRSKRVRKSRNSGFDGFSMNGPFFPVKKSKFETERKSKNNHHEHSSLVEPEPLSSISDTTPEEHVAHCLIMLSRDKWRREEKEYLDEEEEGKFENDYSEDSGVQVKVIKTKVRGKYRCEACNKLFRSYQALGGHRASHKKIKPTTAADAPPQVVEKIGGSKAVVEEKIHECPFCHRIFSSGQALGGHKRSHFLGAGAISASVSTIRPVKQDSRTGETLKIDLNLPAPADDDDTSQIAVSAVSDAEFVQPIKQS